MRDSCSCGKEVYELDEKIIRIHDLESGRIAAYTYDTEAKALDEYQRLTGLPDDILGR